MLILLACTEKKQEPLIHNDIITVQEENNLLQKQKQLIPIQKQNSGNNDILFINEDEHITNETCILINKLYKHYRHEILGDYNDPDFIEWMNRVGEERIFFFFLDIELLLVDFFKTEESWSIDVKKELPFMYEISTSEDGLVRIYNWNYEWATGDTFNSIIQYKTESGIINVIQVSGYGEHMWEREDLWQLGFRDGPAYSIGFKIEEQTYLIWSHARAGGFMTLVTFLAIKLLDGKIEPYLAFNGDNKLEFHVGRIIENYNIQFDETPFYIKIIFNLRKDLENYSKWTEDPDFRYVKPNIYDILEFTFNGTEFLGDYAQFNEITQR
jgi:hypothetical protein